MRINGHRIIWLPASLLALSAGLIINGCEDPATVSEEELEVETLDNDNEASDAPDDKAAPRHPSEDHDNDDGWGWHGGHNGWHGGGHGGHNGWHGGHGGWHGGHGGWHGGHGGWHGGHGGWHGGWDDDDDGHGHGGWDDDDDGHDDGGHDGGGWNDD